MIRPWRLAAIGLTFVGLLAILVLRLWFLQVAAGEANTAQAEQNRTATFTVETPRGEIVDREGVLLASNRSSMTLIVDRSELTLEAEEELVQRLAVLLDLEAAELRDRIEAAPSLSRFPLVIDVPTEAAFEIQEWADSEFRGVEVRPVPVRTYPEGATAAHVLGYIGRPDADDLEENDYLDPGDVFGRGGVELAYDEALQGVRGLETYRVDRAGGLLELTGQLAPRAGPTAVLTLDLELQKVVEEALAAGIELGRAELPEHATGKASAVVLDARNFDILAMASLPSYDPNEFVGGISEVDFAIIQEQESLLNLAIQGLYPPGSVFKIAPYTFALDQEIYPEGVSSPRQEIFLEAQVVFDLQDGSQQAYRDWTYPEPQGSTSLRTSIPKSADVYYYQLALAVWERFKGTANEAILQRWARRMGYGETTGIDLPFENRGVVPDREWLEDVQTRFPDAYRSAPWVGGDLINLSIGQGDVQVTPLQVAVSFGAAVNGGRVYQPRVVSHFLEADGDVVDENSLVLVEDLELDPETVAFVREDLRQVVNAPYGTAFATFADFGPGLNRVGGKTGTAQIGPRDDDVDTAWFVGVAPTNDPRYVVAVVIDRGGGGSKVAAPVVKSILQYLLQGEAQPVVAGGEGE